MKGFQRLECRGASIAILAVFAGLVLTFIGACSVYRPEAVFDAGIKQNFWLVTAGGLLTGLTTALSGTKRNNGDGQGKPDARADLRGGNHNGGGQ